MRIAIDWISGQPVAAPNARRGREYRCPCCGGKSYPRVGTVYTPHFAHKSGGVNPLCEEYHPGNGRPSPSGFRSSGVTEYLHLDRVSGRWHLFIELDEIPLHESHGVSPSFLVFDGIEIRQTGREPRRVAADGLWPGAARNLVDVAPSRKDTYVQTTGRWPSTLALARWRKTLPGLPATGVLFVQVHGGTFQRYEPQMRVHWGQNLVWVGPQTVQPPKQLQPLPLDPVRHDETWFAWVLELPPNETPVVMRWLSKFGVEPTSRWRHTRILTPPTDYTDNGVPRYRTGEQTIVRPAEHAEFLVAESGGEVRGSSLTRSARTAQPLGITTESTGRTQIRTDVRGDWVDYHAVDHTGTEPIANAWSLRTAENVVQPFTTRRAKIHPHIFEVETTVTDLRFSVSAEQHDGGLSTARDLDAQAASMWLRDKARTCRELEVDAGNLGFIRILLDEPVPEDGHRPRAGWATAYRHAAAAGPGSDWARRLHPNAGRAAGSPSRRP